MGEVFRDFVPPVSAHVQSIRAGSTFVQPLNVVEVRSDVAEEDGDLEGVLKVGVPDMESVERPGGNAAAIQDFIASGFRGQREFERVQMFASGSEWYDALLNVRHQQV